MRENAFARTREDHRSELAEDYVELIYRILLERRLVEGDARVRTSDLVAALQVSQPTVTKTLERLQRDGLVAVHPRNRIELTEEGESVAREALDRHVLIVGFLEAIGVPKEVAELDAEGIEHHVSATTQGAMSKFLSRRGA
jgi:DtxR family manganese transport transcriptional regulator